MSLANNGFPANGVENTGYLGIPLIVLVIALVDLVGTPTRSVRLLVADDGDTCVVLSLGTRLWVDGRLTKIALPWYLVRRLPLLHSAVTVRFSAGDDVADRAAAHLRPGPAAERPRVRHRPGGRRDLPHSVATDARRQPYNEIDHIATPRFFTTSAVNAIQPGSTALLLPQGDGPFAAQSADVLADSSQDAVQHHRRLQRVQAGRQEHLRRPPPRYRGDPDERCRRPARHRRNRPIAAAKASLAPSTIRYIVITDQVQHPESGRRRGGGDHRLHVHDRLPTSCSARSRTDVRVGFDATPLLGRLTGIGHYVDQLVANLPAAADAAGVELDLDRDRVHAARPRPTGLASPAARRRRSGARPVPARALRAAWATHRVPARRMAVRPRRHLPRHQLRAAAAAARGRGRDRARPVLPALPRDGQRRLAALPRARAPQHRAGRVVCTLTEAMRDEIAAEYRIDPDRIHVTYPGVDESWFEVAAAGREPTCARLGLPDALPARRRHARTAQEPRPPAAGLRPAAAQRPGDAADRARRRGRLGSGPRSRPACRTRP